MPQGRVTEREAAPEADSAHLQGAGVQLCQDWRWLRWDGVWKLTRVSDKTSPNAGAIVLRLPLSQQPDSIIPRFFCFSLARLW